MQGVASGDAEKAARRGCGEHTDGAEATLHGTREPGGRVLPSVGCKEPTAALGDDEAKRVSVEGATRWGGRGGSGGGKREPRCGVAPPSWKLK